MPSAFGRRIYKLEGKLNCREPVCRTCGAPHTVAPRVLITTNTDPLPRCPECDRVLNPEDGRPMPDSFKWIVLAQRDPAWESATSAVS